MKKLSIICVSMLLCAVFSASCFAQQAPVQKKAPAAPLRRQAPVDARQRQAENMLRMFIATSKIVATTDHGVVVMVGNKLYKYDRGLRLIKEAEIELNTKDFEKLITGR
jgi:hypothetical protein